MSFTCMECRKPQPRGTQPNKVRIQARQVTYIQKDARIGVEISRSRGEETVKEHSLCPLCALPWRRNRMQLPPEERTVVQMVPAKPYAGTAPFLRKP